MSDSLYTKLSKERKQQQADGLLPMWYSTGGWQLFKSKYLWADSWRSQVEHICNVAASHMKNPKEWESRFFELFWNGWLSASTPVLANMGTDRGLNVSCSGGYVSDSVAGFYEALTEMAVLTKHGFGTSGYLNDIRPRGTPISTGGKASGVLPVIKSFVQASRDVAQGSTRRGAFASYLSIEHGDFFEVLGHIEAHPDDLNIGWIIQDSFIKRLNSGDQDAINRYQSALRVKASLGRGYFFFTDKVNRARPQMYKDRGLDVKASNLCSEISLHSSESETFSCVLSSMVVANYDEWKDTDAVFVATVFLDCVVSEFLSAASCIKHLEKVVSFTRKGRAIGLGQLGLFSLFQKRGIPPESLEAHLLNISIAKHIESESLRASKWLAEEYGEPEWCKGYGVRNTHRIAIAPTKSTSLLSGGYSEGINPDPAMAFSASSAGGDIDRVNPVLLSLIKDKGLNLKKCTSDILANAGSVQNVEWLTPEEKAVFKTAFEIDQHVLVRYTAARQKYVDQGQSFNLFFAHDDTEEYISSVHQHAFENENIHSLYYVYGSSEIKAQRTGECEACQ